jgi:hypothetical protein
MKIVAQQRKTRDFAKDEPKRFYSVAKLSSRLSETPEGFLVCEGVPITRAGDLLYAPSETPVDAGAGGHTVISRTVEDIHDPATIASFEGKPVTINHPDDFVTPENWRELAVGVVQNVRPGVGDDADKLLADLLITDAEAISAVKSKRLREVSCGYEAEYIQVSPGRGRQENIIGNHVALVASGRCGSECAIFDHAPQKEKTPMTMKEKLMGIFGKALDEAMPEDTPKAEAADQPDLTEVLATIMARLEKIEAGMNASSDEEPVAADTEQQDMEGEPKADHTPEEMMTLEERLMKMEGNIATIAEALAKIVGPQEEAPMEDEEVVAQVDKYTDSATMARAEILAPGIAKSKDVKAKALKAAYATEDGKAVIESLLGGKAFDSADKDMLFVAASEMLKGVRRSQLNARVALDSLPSMKAGAMTPEKINELNAARFGTR